MLTKVLSIKGAHEMSREAQKSVRGGSGTCGAYLPAGYSYEGAGFQGGDILPSGDFYRSNSDGSVVWGGISKDEALSLVNNTSGARWCCDSCGEASWYQ